MKMLTLSSQDVIKGNVLFVFSDPAGAKALLSCAWLQKNLKQSFFFISNRDYEFYKDFEFQIMDFASKSVMDWLDEIKPVKLIAGTSLPVNLEAEFTSACKKRMIHTISFVDHWTNFYKRFYFQNRLVLPDKLFVIDEIAYNNAVRDNIPTNILAIESNPYKLFLELWKPKVSRIELLINLGMNPDDHYILFAPEPLLKFGLDKKYGFSEKNGLDDFIKIYEKSGIFKKYKLVIKPHPNHDFEFFSDYSKRYILLNENINLNELIFYSNAVIGFFSNSLIESLWMKKKVIRVLLRITNKNDDPLLHIQFGASCYSEEKLLDELLRL